MTIYHLHAPLGESAVDDAIPAELPKEIAGQPVSYFWKDIIRSGEYVHPGDGSPVSVTADRLDHWAKTFERMSANGVRVYIPCDHSESAENNRGYVVGMKRQGDTLLALCQMIGEDAAREAARNEVSVGIAPEFVDGQANAYPDAIVHVALTPVPVVASQSRFVQASREEETVTLSMPAVMDATDATTRAQLDLAVARGALTPHCRDRLVALLGRSGRQTQTLSRGGEVKPLGLAIAQILAENKPIALAEATGIQVLHRAVPGEEESTGRSKWREQMISIASGRKV